MRFAVDDADAGRLLDADGDDDAVMAIIEAIEESGSRPHADTDKARDAIHRSLTDGRLEWDKRHVPAERGDTRRPAAVRGDDYIVFTVDP